MANSHYRLKIQLNLEGPLLTRGEATDPGIDAPMMKDEIGRFAIPFSLIKGKVLDALVD